MTDDSDSASTLQQFGVDAPEPESDADDNRADYREDGARISNRCEATWYQWLAKPDYVNVGTAVGAAVAGFTLSILSEGDDLLWLIFLAIVAVVNLYVAMVNAARRRYEAYQERMAESDLPNK